MEVPLNPPTGRLVGIVDLGDKLYALIRNETDNKSLYEGDELEGWTVDSISTEKMVLVAGGGKQRTEMALIGDFAAPQANKQMLASKQRRDQRKRQRQLRQQQRRQRLLQQQGNANANTDLRQQALQAAAQMQGGADINKSTVEQLSQALMGNSAQGANAQQPAPVLSIKEALEARQRLMASRWGNNKKKQEGQ